MPPAPSLLLGRASVLSAISRAAREGHGTVLTGPRGSGGTRLLTEVRAGIRRAGLRVGRLVPAPDDARQAFLPLLDRAALAALPDEAPSTIRAATLALGLDVVVLDDTDRLDEETGGLLIDLARAGTAIVANATGPADAPAPLRRLVAEGRADLVPLEPLTFDEVERLAGELLGDPVDGDLALALAGASGGRPGTLSEIVDDAVGSRSIAHADGLWRLIAPLPAPRSVRAAVLEAFTELSPAHRGWVAAVAQAGLLADDLARRVAAAESITAADEAGWTVRDFTRGGTRIASDSIASSVLGALDLRARVTVLRRLIAAMEAAGRPLDDLERAAVLRWRIEVGLPVDAEEAWRLALLPALEPAAREVLLRAAFDGGAPAGADLADHLRRTRRPEQAVELIDGALEGTRDADQRVALVRVRAMTTGMIERNPVDALRVLDEHLLDPDPHADLVAVRAGMLLMEGRPHEAMLTAASAVSASDRSGFADAFGLLQLSLAHRELGDLDAAIAGSDRLLALDRARDGFPDGAALARWLPLELAVAVGADPSVEAGLVAEHAAVPVGLRTSRRPPLSYTLAGVHLLRGDPATAARLLHEADGGGGAWREGWQPRVLAELAIAQALSGALDEAGATRDRLSRLTCPVVHLGRVELASAQIAMALGDAERARSIARGVAERGRETGLALDAFDGVLAGIRYGDPEAPERLLGLGPFPSGPGREVQRAYAAALLTADAASVDRASVRLWDAGLRMLAIEAAARAVALGSVEAGARLVAWRARTPSLRLPSLPDRRTTALTRREREVALLAAQGASDRAIALELDITLRTAQTHLSRALGKLGIHRRAELRGLVIEP